MTAEAFAGVGGFLARYEGLRQYLPGDPEVRAAAAEAFGRMGVPGGSSDKREEAWKYTNLRPLAEASFQEPLTSLLDAGAVLNEVPRIAASRLKLAESLEKMDKPQGALMFYREIIRDEPDTEAARIAAERIKALGREVAARKGP